VCCSVSEACASSGIAMSALHTQVLAGSAVFVGQALLADAQVCDGMCYIMFNRHWSYLLTSFQICPVYSATGGGMYWLPSLGLWFYDWSVVAANVSCISSCNTGSEDKVRSASTCSCLPHSDQRAHKQGARQHCLAGSTTDTVLMLWQPHC